jgi:chromosome segregation ATPase
LIKQLTDEHERVDLELIENEEKLRKLEKEKEDTGVKLYGVQQQLAENQMTFEQAHENYKLVQKLRLDAEQNLGNLNEVYNAKKREIEELKKKYIKAQDELSKLNRTLKTIANHNQQMISERDTIRRTTYRAEENVQNLEKDKLKQDFLIDSMNEEIKRLSEQRIILTAQHISQKKETEQARDILKEAQVEMQKIIASKKNLLERWQKSLINMQRRDNALQAIKEALKYANYFTFSDEKN